MGTISASTGTYRSVITPLSPTDEQLAVLILKLAG